MNPSHCSLCAVAALALGGLAMADVNDTPTERRLSLPSSSAGLVIPREDWLLLGEERRPGDTAVYYMLSSQSRQMLFSVYVDRTDICQSADACLEVALSNPQYKEAKGLQKSALGQFKVAQFALDQPQGAPIKQVHLIASAYVGGLWFDVHISRGNKERPDAAPLFEFLRKIAIK